MNHFTYHLPSREPYSTEELEAAINIYLDEDQPVSLKEENETITWNGMPLSPRCFYMYLPTLESQVLSDIPIDDKDDFPPDPNLKGVQIPYNHYYRCPQTNGKWVLSRYKFVPVGTPNDYIEELSLIDGDVYWHRYIVTTDEFCEDPSVQEFEYYESGDSLTITGVRYYCERLHVPAVINGIPVHNVQLSLSSNLLHLRELIIEDGIKKLSIYLPDSLKYIQIPKNTILTAPPSSITTTQWFKDQPNGPVYFQNYYCGTKGNPATSMLSLRAGTIGVISHADADVNWKTIQLPTSLTYIGTHAFKILHSLEKVEFTAETEDFKEYFFHLYPGSANLLNRKLKRKKQALSDGSTQNFDPLTAFSLYDLANSHVAVRTQIHRSWIPTAPRISYTDRWIAEFWYCDEDMRKIGYSVTFDLDSREPLEVKQLDQNAQCHRSFSFWIESYLSPCYLIAEDYLNHCAELINQGAPSETDLTKIEQWWKQLSPNIEELLEDHDRFYSHFEKILTL